MDHDKWRNQSKPSLVITITLLVTGVATLLVPGRAGLESASQLAGIGQLILAALMYVVGGQSGRSGRIDEDEAYRLLLNAVRRNCGAEISRLKRYPGPIIDLVWRRRPQARGPTAKTTRSRGRGSSRADDQGRVLKLAEHWRRLPAARLVVTGARGSGKTTAMLLLIRDLVAEDRHGPDRPPIPVLVPLSSLSRDDVFEGWLAEQITVRYPVLADPTRERTELATNLIRSEWILPVLDALDELPESLQHLLIEELNGTREAEYPVVLTCRTGSYHRLATGSDHALDFAEVIELDPIEVPVVAEFLERADPVRTRRWDTVLRDIEANRSGPLATVLRNPLMLQLAVDVYHPRTTGSGRLTPDPNELLDRGRFATAEQIREHLFQGYLPALYPSRTADPKGWTAGRAGDWLGFFADLVQNRLDGGPGFGWWHLRLAVPRWYIGGVVGSVAGICYGVVNALGERVGVGAGIGLLPGVLAGLAVAWPVRAGAERLRRRITRRHPRWRVFAHDWRDPVGGLVGGLLGGLLGAVVAGHLGEHDLIGNADGWVSALPGALGVGIWLGPAVGVAGAVFGSAVGGCVAGALVECLQGVPAGLATGLAVAIAVGVAVTVPRRHPPAGGIRWSRVGLASAATMAVTVGAATATVTTPARAVVVGVIAGAVTALAGGITGTAVDPETVLRPKELVRLDRQAFIRIGTVYGLASFLVAGSVAGLTGTVSRGEEVTVGNLVGSGVAIGVVVGIGLGLVFAFRQTAWGSYRLARTRLLRQGSVPRETLEFLADARDKGVLGQIGAYYVFRHGALRRHLAANRPGARRGAPGRSDQG